MVRLSSVILIIILCIVFILPAANASYYFERHEFEMFKKTLCNYVESKEKISEDYNNEKWRFITLEYIYNENYGKTEVIVDPYKTTLDDYEGSI